MDLFLHTTTGIIFCLLYTSIIICKEKKRTIVEYALKNIGKPIGVASYQISNTLPEDLKSLLPSPDEIEKRMALLD